MAKLYFKYGAMGSSKTATALITKYNYEERGMRVWLIKPAADRRDGEFTLRSRIGLTAQCEAIGPECDLREQYAAHGRADVIIVDECQFLTGQQIDQLRELVDRENLPVLCFGLRTDFLTHFFPGARRLMELADSITEIKTVCACGRKATVNARIDGSGERLGAVAGWADGTVSGNYYLQEKAVGIDGIDYAGQTAPLSFGAFSALEGIPADFLTFRVTFQAGERVVDTVEVPYGGSLDPAAFPEVPSDGGRYGAWAPFDHNHITRSLTVEAVYEDWVTTISSGGERPLLLAEGAFSPDARLELAQRPEPGEGRRRDRVSAGYRIYADGHRSLIWISR